MRTFLCSQMNHISQILNTNLLQICVNWHFTFARIIHRPDWTGISRYWLDNMITGWPWTDHSIMCSFMTWHNTTDVQKTLLLWSTRTDRDTVTRSWGPLSCHSITVITLCCSMIMHYPMLRGSVLSSGRKLKTSQFLFYFLFWHTQPLKWRGPTLHGLSTIRSTLCKGGVTHDPSLCLWYLCCAQKNTICNHSPKFSFILKLFFKINFPFKSGCLLLPVQSTPVHRSCCLNSILTCHSCDMDA